jgi:hypothetical protein
MEMLCGDGGMSSYQSIETAFQQIAEMGAKIIATMGDTPGGEAYACFETGKNLRAIADAYGVKWIAYKDLEDFKKLAISSLKSRLDAYKRDKLKNSGNSIDLKDFAKEVKKAGFLDKFLVNGFVFNYYDDRINFSKMRTGHHKPDQNGYSDPSYITYRVDDSSQEYVELRNKYWDARADLSANFKGDPEAFHREHNKLKKRLKVPPNRIKILLDLEGGAIVPYDVELDYTGI